MGRKNYNSYIKKLKQEKKRKKKEEKRQKMEERKEQDNSTSLEDMLAYVDEFGNLVSEPPEESNEKDHSEDNK
jgi:S-adenosylmethionine hydrolase